MEQIFTQQGSSGQTGVYNEAEDGGWGNSDGLIGQPTADDPLGGVARSRAGWARYRSIFNPADSDNNIAQINKGFVDRRADFRSGGGAMTDAGEPGGINNFARNQTVNYCKYD